MFTIGADPELFVKKNGKLIAATGLVEGDKASPKKVIGGAIQVDGLALEFNVDPVSSENFVNFNHNIVQVIRQLKEEAKKVGGNGITFDISSWVDFPQEYYDALPEDSKQLGCDPDFNAYEEGRANPSPDANTNRRGAAGHLHIGWGDNIPIDHPEHVENCCRIVKMLDQTVGMASIIINPDVTRREHYGKAGAFRAKPYGVEYRVPDNSWIKTKASRAFIFEILRRTLQSLGTGKEERFLSMAEKDIRNCINTTGDSGYATAVLQTLFPSVPVSLAAYKGW